MTIRHWLPTLCTSVLLLTASLIPACGIVTAPVSVPKAIAENMNFSLHGPIVDQDGNPLNGVVMQQYLSHYFWTPIKGEAYTREEKLRTLDGQYHVNERGTYLGLTFTKDGYHPVKYSISTRTGPVVRFRTGTRFNALTIGWDEWAIDGKTPLPIVMYAKAPADSNLKIRYGSLYYNFHDPKKATEDHGRFDDWQLLLTPQERLRHDRDHGDELPAGIVYLTFEKGKDLPKQITLHINSDDGGLIRIDTKYGYAPFLSAAEAPDSGYSPTITIENARLEEMWSAREDDLIGAHEYFYFRHNGHYGKGMIKMNYTRRESERSTPSFSYKIFMARTPGDRQLISRKPPER